MVTVSDVRNVLYSTTTVSIIRVLIYVEPANAKLVLGLPTLLNVKNVENCVDHKAVLKHIKRNVLKTGKYLCQNVPKRSVANNVILSYRPIENIHMSVVNIDVIFAK